jgi:hypothetical protein
MDSSYGCLLSLKLITSDADFTHLDQVFIDVEVLTPELFRAK